MNKLTIIKIGTSVIIDESKNVRTDVLDSLFKSLKPLIEKGERFIVVASGAVALGRKDTGDWQLEKPLAAGVGQPILMSYFRTPAQRFGLIAAELLLSRPHLVRRGQFLSLQKKINNFLTHPELVLVANENDFLVNGTDWGFGDNDSMSASLAIALSATKLLIVSNIDGLYKDGDINNPQNLLAEVADVNAELMKYCAGEKSQLGIGGMISKLKAARLCRAVCIETQIINGLKGDQLQKVLNGEKIGTTFLAHKSCQVIRNRERWILAARSSAASIEVDDGAVQALKNGKSLLAVGIKKIYGSFEVGELVEVVNSSLETVAIGVADIGSDSLSKTDFKEQKGAQVMHTDNVMVFV